MNQIDYENARGKKKNWLLTYPHCSAHRVDVLNYLMDEGPWDRKHVHVQYMVVGEEEHVDGQPHLHVFFQTDYPFSLRRDEMNLFDIPKDLSLPAVQAVNEVWHCNIEKITSRPKMACDYAKKGRKIHEYGVCPFKDDLTKKEKNELLQTKSLTELVQSGEISIFKVPTLQRALNVLRMERMDKLQAQKPTVHWFYGKTGFGKTRTAWEEARSIAGDDIWVSLSDDKWFDGYVGQKVAILDDIRSNGWNFNMLLRLLDRYKLVVPIKGGFTRWCPEHIFITCPETPRRMYRNYQTGQPYDGIEQLERRIDDFREFTKDGNETRSFEEAERNQEDSNGKEVEGTLNWK